MRVFRQCWKHPYNADHLHNPTEIALSPRDLGAPPPTMDWVGDFAIHIRRVLEARPIYTVVALSLGFTLYRWNANRVGYTICVIIKLY